MSKIVIGEGLEMDINELLRTRLLLQANSGGGKSWMLRRICEELFGRVPMFIIDPEGEFSTLREKFDYVLVGPEGEVPADPNSAAIVAERLLDLRVSAVCDIYELKPEDRHTWVRGFLDAIIDAPKNLWHPRIVIVDEAHIFAPERGIGESEAGGSMIDLATRGRKRGLCPIFASQRLSKLSKNATAELLNRLVGPTFEDLDLDRAADLLSVSRGDREAFFKEMKTLEPGNFYGLGRAISKERVKVKVGPVRTTHPEMGSGAYAYAPTPAPEKVKALLHKLEGIPQMVEQKARTEDALRMEIKGLKDQLAQRPVGEKIEVAGKIERIEVPVIKGAELARVELVLEQVDRAGVKMESYLGVLRSFVDAVRSEVKSIEGAAKTGVREKIEKRVEVPKVADVPRPDEPVEGGLGRSQKAILKALVEFKQMGVEAVPRTHLASWLGLKVAGSFLNNLAALKALFYIESNSGRGDEKTVVLTPDGQKLAPETVFEATPEAVFDQLRTLVANPQKAILDLCKEKYPNWTEREDLAAALGLQVSGSFLNNISELHTSALIEYGMGDQKNQVRLLPWTILAG